MAIGRLRVVRAAARVIYGTNTLGSGVAIVRDASVLLVRDIHRPRELSLPGGFVRRKENPAKAASRELMEEVSIRATFDLEDCTILVDARFPHIHCLWRLDFDPDRHGTPEVRSWETRHFEWHRLSVLPLEVLEGTRAQLRSLHLVP